MEPIGCVRESSNHISYSDIPQAYTYKTEPKTHMGRKVEKSCNFFELALNEKHKQ